MRFAQDLTRRRKHQMRQNGATGKLRMTRMRGLRVGQIGRLIQRAA